jgi:chemotaxis protein methyltransferase WspC
MSALVPLAQALEARADLNPALLREQSLLPLLEERRSALRLSSIQEYAKFALQDAPEFSSLQDLISVPETWLFRYPASFELLKAWLSNRSHRPFRALSVACATGAEPFSIAATALAAGIEPSTIHITALDRSAPALALARMGTLGRLSVRDGVPWWAASSFPTQGDGWCVSKEVAASITWLEGSAPQALKRMEAGSFDAIFCRNLGIYMRPQARQELGSQLSSLLDPDGMLFLGHAEPSGLFDLGAGFTPADPPASFAFSRAVPRTLAKPTAPPPTPADRGVPPAPTTAPPTLASLTEAQAAADQGRLREALHLAQQHHRSGDRSCELFLLLGSAHAALGEPDTAEGFLRQALYLQPFNIEALLQLASLAERRGEVGLAERYRLRAARSPSTQEGAA